MENKLEDSLLMDLSDSNVTPDQGLQCVDTTSSSFEESGEPSHCFMIL